ncbi:MAG: LysE family translocator, partial [Jatrophihabitantaceae bacterium]
MHVASDYSHADSHHSAYSWPVLLALAGFCAAAVLIVLLPGPDTLVVVRSVVRGGRPLGTMTAVGNLCGLTLWVTAAALGLAAVLRASETGYEVLRIVGAVYLIWLGIQSFRSLRRPLVELPPPSERRSGLLGTGFTAGMLTNLLNPKVGVFFVTFLPGFVPHGYSVGWTTLMFGG